jgi:tetratricopeptide (TPR) repeat protein
MRPVEATAALRKGHPSASPATATAPPVGRTAETIAALDRAESLIGEHRYSDAVEALSALAAPVASTPQIALRMLLAESWGRMYLGHLGRAVSILERARVLAESPLFTDVDRAEAMFRLGCCRLKLGKVSNAISIFGSALELAGGGGLEGERLCARVFDWRSRCHQLQRDWETALADAERGLELAESIGDARLAAHALMQCSLVAERSGDPLLGRFYAERARTFAVAAGDRQIEARLLNNLGGLSFLLGDPEIATGYLKESFAVALEVGNDADAAQAVSSLAQVHLRSGAPLLAEEQARYALSLLGDRQDYRDERGNTHLVLGQALLALDRGFEALTEFAAAEWQFETLGSASHVAAAWLAQGDAHRRLGDLECAADMYRRAAEKLQDFNF